MKKNKLQAASVVALFAAYFLGYLIRYSPSVIMPVIQQELNLSSSITGMISSLYLFSYAAQQFFLGPLCKKFTSERVCAVGLVIASAGLILFGIGKNVFLLALGRFLLGLGTGPFFISLLFTLQNNYSGSTYVRVYGYSILVSNFGSIISSTPLSILLNKFGRNAVFTVFSVLAVVLAFVLFVLAKNSAYGQDEASDQNSILRQLGSDAKQLFTSRLLVGALLIWFIQCMALASYQGLWCVKFTSVAYPAFTNIASLSGVFISLGVMFSSYFCEKWRLKSRTDNIFLSGIIGVSATLIMVLAQQLPQSPVSLACSLFADFILGYANGNIIVQIGAFVRENTSKDDNANIMGVFNGIGCLVQQGSQWISGVLIDVFGIYCLQKASFSWTYLVFAAVFAVITVSSRILIKKE